MKQSTQMLGGSAEAQGNRNNAERQTYQLSCHQRGQLVEPDAEHLMLPSQRWLA